MKAERLVAKNYSDLTSMADDRLERDVLIAESGDPDDVVVGFVDAAEPAHVQSVDEVKDQSALPEPIPAPAPVSPVAARIAEDSPLSTPVLASRDDEVQVISPVPPVAARSTSPRLVVAPDIRQRRKRSLSQQSATESPSPSSSGTGMLPPAPKKRHT